MSFFDLGVAARGGGNRVLEAIDSFVDFGLAQKALEQTYSKLGRPAHRVSVMLRIMILQHLYGLSDPQAEEQLRDRLSFQKFVGLSAEQRIPDESSICRFRERMIQSGLHEQLLDQMNAQLEAAGLMVRRTILVDATLVQSSRSRPPKEDIAQQKASDPDARYSRKGGKSYYGYKAHIGVCGQHHLIDRAKATAANVDDSKVFAELIDPRAWALYADKAYESNLNKQWLAEHGIANGVLKKAAMHVKLTEADQRRNQRKEKRRRHVERVFAHLKKWQNYVRVRYAGLVKNQLELTLKAVAYNLKRFASLSIAACK